MNRYPSLAICRHKKTPIKLLCVKVFWWEWNEGENEKKEEGQKSVGPVKKRPV